MISTKYISKNKLIRHDENGSFCTTKGSRHVSIFGLKLFNHYWDTEYEDLTGFDDKKKPGFIK